MTATSQVISFAWQCASDVALSIAASDSDAAGTLPAQLTSGNLTAVQLSANSISVRAEASVSQGKVQPQHVSERVSQGTLPDWGGLMPELETFLMSSNYLTGDAGWPSMLGVPCCADSSAAGTLQASWAAKGGMPSLQVGPMLTTSSILHEAKRLTTLPLLQSIELWNNRCVVVSMPTRSASSSSTQSQQSSAQCCASSRSRPELTMRACVQSGGSVPAQWSNSSQNATRCCLYPPPCTSYPVLGPSVKSAADHMIDVRSGMPKLAQIAVTSSHGQGRGQLCGPLPSNAFFVDFTSNTSSAWEPFNGTLPSCGPLT